jgi:hypothetical protein
MHKDGTALLLFLLTEVPNFRCRGDGINAVIINPIVAPRLIWISSMVQNKVQPHVT